MFLFARLCGNGVGMGTKSTVTEWGWDDMRSNGVGMGTEFSKRCGNGLGTGTRIYYAGR